MSAEREHTYAVAVVWTGNTGTGTTRYDRYDRDHEILVQSKPTIAGSSDPAFRGDNSRHNPEELLVASLSTCHMLWYLHLCSQTAVNVLAYSDEAIGLMTQTSEGGGRFAEVVLRPHVVMTENSDQQAAHAAHVEANRLCFIANSVNFPVRHEPTVEVAAPDPSLGPSAALGP